MSATATDVLMPDQIATHSTHSIESSAASNPVSLLAPSAAMDSSTTKRASEAVPDSNEQATSSAPSTPSKRPAKRARFDLSANVEVPSDENASTSASGSATAPATASSNTVSQPVPRTAIRHLPQATSPAPISPALPTFWHDDGDLVIVARDDARFRVHAMRLAAASTTFAAYLADSSCEPPAQLTPAAARPPYAYISQKDRDAAKEASGRAATIIAERYWKSTNTAPRTISDCPAILLDEDSPRDWVVALEASYDFLFVRLCHPLRIY